MRNSRRSVRAAVPGADAPHL
eukprot:SAG11_NODE_32345_length_284_cov_0.918919_1_plen_20_part_01